MRIIGNVPAAAVLAAVKVKVDVPVMFVGLNVTPVGRPEAVRAIVPVKPPEGATVRVLVPLAPATTLALLAERVKSGAGVTAAGVNVYMAV